jgi:hypothetical protein
MVRAILASEGLLPSSSGLDEHLLARALSDTNGSMLHVNVKVHQPITAIGAPSPTYWPRSAELLSAPLLVPENAHVANAVGAVVGSVVVRLKAQVTPSEDSTCYIAFTPSERRQYASAEAAVAFAIAHCTALAEVQALAAGAANVRLSVARHDHSAPIGPAAEEDSYLFTDLVITAAGRPALAGMPVQQRQ